MLEWLRMNIPNLGCVLFQFKNYEKGHIGSKMVAHIHLTKWSLLKGSGHSRVTLHTTQCKFSRQHDRKQNKCISCGLIDLINWNHEPIVLKYFVLSVPTG